MKAAERPDWDSWALGLATAVSLRGDCTRRRVGAVLLDKDHRIIGAGYNGSWPGGPSCLKGDCPRGLHFRAPEPYDRRCSNCCGPDEICSDCLYLFLCACGQEWPCSDAVDPGSSYDTGPGACHASHAEQNTLADVEARYRLDGATMYVTEAPCDGCLKQIRNTTRIARIAWPGGVHLLGTAVTDLS